MAAEPSSKPVRDGRNTFLAMPSYSGRRFTAFCKTAGSRPKARTRQGLIPGRWRAGMRIAMDGISMKAAPLTGLTRRNQTPRRQTRRLRPFLIQGVQALGARWMTLGAVSPGSRHTAPDRSGSGSDREASVGGWGGSGGGLAAPQANARRAPTIAYRRLGTSRPCSVR